MEALDHLPIALLVDGLICAFVGSFATWLRMRGRIKAAEQSGMRQMRSLIRAEAIQDRRDRMPFSR